MLTLVSFSFMRRRRRRRGSFNSRRGKGSAAALFAAPSGPGEAESRPPSARAAPSASHTVASVAAAAAAAPPALGAPSGLPQTGWKSVPGPFHVVAGAVISCRNEAAPNGIAPRAHLSDGCVDLLAVRACSRPSYLHHLLRLNNPSLGDHTDLSFVTNVKARAFRFTPARETFSGESRWNVDGELLAPSSNALTARGAFRTSRAWTDLLGLESNCRGSDEC